MHKNGLVKFIAILFTFISILQISYTYVVSKSGYTTQTGTITVQGSDVSKTLTFKFLLFLIASAIAV